MFKKLYGLTDKEQLAYLQPRAIVTIIFLALGLVVLLLFYIGIEGVVYEIFSGIVGIGIMVMIFVWGWRVVKGLFGITIEAIFSFNFVIGIVIFVFYIMLLYILGIIFAFIGTARYIYLKAKSS